MSKDNCPFAHGENELRVKSDIDNISHTSDKINSYTESNISDTYNKIPKDDDELRLMIRSALKDLKYENGTELGEIIGGKITQINTFEIVAEEIISYGEKDPKPNLIYFTKKLNHNRIFKNIENILKNRIHKEILDSEEKNIPSKALINLGLILGQFLTAGISQNTINSFIENIIL